MAKNGGGGGLPHAHILIWRKEKIVPTQIDSVIFAELPNQQEDPILFDVCLQEHDSRPMRSIEYEFTLHERRQMHEKISTRFD